jgi:hypothetical protein
MQYTPYFAAASGSRTYPSGAIINRERILKSARCAVRVAVIAQRRSACIDRLLENIADRWNEFLCPLSRCTTPIRQRARRSVRR